MLVVNRNIFTSASVSRSITERKNRSRFASVRLSRIQSSLPGDHLNSDVLGSSTGNPLFLQRVSIELSTSFSPSPSIRIAPAATSGPILLREGCSVLRHQRRRSTSTGAASIRSWTLQYNLPNEHPGSFPKPHEMYTGWIRWIYRRIRLNRLNGCCPELRKYRN
jgi:hypothetical protein